MVRISKIGTEEPRIYHPAILQAIAAWEIDGMRIEILPKIHTFTKEEIANSDIPKAAAKKVREALQSSGLRVNDISESNVGLLPDGTPVAYDFGVIKTTKIKPYKAEEIYNLADWFDVSGKWKQQIYFPQIMSGKPNGVVLNSELTLLEVDGRVAPEHLQQLRDGYYPEQIPDLNIELLNDVLNKCEALESEAYRDKAEPSMPLAQSNQPQKKCSKIFRF